MIVRAMLDRHKRMRYLGDVNPHSRLVVSCQDNHTYRVSAIPTDLALALSISVVVGMYLGAPMRFACSMKLIPQVSADAPGGGMRTY